MALSGLRKNVITIINRVQRKLGIPSTTILTDTHPNMLLDFLNETITEVSDFGKWQEAFTTANVTAQSSIARYSVDTQDIIQGIEEISYDGKTSPLFVEDGETIRRLNRNSGTGTPRQFAVQGTNSAGNPVFEVSRIPGSNETGKLFQVIYYVKPDILETTDVSAVPFFPAELLFRGTYAKALLEENGGEISREYLAAFNEYDTQKQEALNRYTSDTGTNVQFVPKRFS